MGDAMTDWERRLSMNARPKRTTAGRKLLGASPTIETCLGTWTREEVRRLGESIGLGGLSALTKPHLATEVARALTEAETLARLVGSLAEPPLRALREVLERGGQAPYAEFTRVHGTLRMDGSPDRLLASYGLLFEGTIGDQACVVTPCDLRGPLGEALSLLARVGR